jgi:hydroxymethylbilane synthase
MSATIDRPIRIATRPSALAQRQTQLVRARLQALWPDLQVEVVIIHTQGDKELSKPLPEIGGKGLFTAELENALRSRAVDMAVHSLKDLPIEDAPELTVGAILMRADPGEGLISRNGETLESMPPGALLGTSSPRRAAQLLNLRADLDIRPIRGNVETRVRKVLDGQYDAALMAVAGLARMGLEKHISQRFSPLEFLPAPGQGALGVQCRAHDPLVGPLVQALDEPSTRRAVEAERAFLSALGGGCSAPVGAYAHVDGDQVELVALVGSQDGKRIVRVQGRGESPMALGQKMAEAALAQGARELIDEAAL